MINEANNLDQTAIIDCRGPDPGAAHDSYRAFAVRDRLDRAHGSHANQMIWEGPAPIIGDTKCALNSLITMDRWLAAVERDHSVPAGGAQDRGGQAHRRHRPVLGRHRPPPDQWPVPARESFRCTARRGPWPGDAMTTDTNKCQLKPFTGPTTSCRSPTPSGRRCKGPSPRGVRLLQARGGAAADDPVDDVPDRQRAGHHRRPADAGGAEIGAARLTATGPARSPRSDRSRPSCDTENEDPYTLGDFMPP